MPRRNGKHLSVYLPDYLKQHLIDKAKSERTSVTKQVIKLILSDINANQERTLDELRFRDKTRD